MVRLSALGNQVREAKE